MKNDDETDQFLTAAELSKRWDIDPQTLRIWRREGRGPKYVTLGERTVRYPLAFVVQHERKNVGGG